MGAFVKLPSKSLHADLGRTGKEGYICPESAAAYQKLPSLMNHRMSTAFKEAGVGKAVKQEGWLRSRPLVSFHLLRHTFVTRAISAGIPIAIVRALVGHTTEMMTNHYSHIEAETVAKAFEQAGM